MKKVLITIAIIFATTLTLSAQFSGGSGTQADPYQITSKADMEELADYVGTITNCVNIGNIISGGDAAGIVGYMDFLSDNATISNCVNTGYVKGVNVGGIIGVMYTQVNIRSK
ncbi:MAG: hypothetical protein LBO69_07290 [Ignavibacteria bacterium]|jgi:hypothetical protein|nr:hypothetical protein [Ignavibacteria bacterium]